MNPVSSRSFGAGLIMAALALTACGNNAAPESGKPAGSGAASTGATTAKSAAPTAAANAKVASCNGIKKESLCREYGDANISAAGEDFLKKMCEGLGDFKMEACPKDKRIGSCVTPEGTKMYYSEGPLPMDAAKAEKACKEGIPAGEWKPN